MMFRHYLILFYIVSGVFSGTACAEITPKLFEQNLCLQVKFFQGQPLEDLSVLKKLGVKWVREEDKWSQIELKPGQYKALSAALQKRLTYYKANDIGVIFILAYENPEAYPNSVKKPANFVNVNGYANYAAYMAKALKLSGVKFKLELWNEPHNSLFAKKEYLGGRWHGGPPSPWLDHYVEMVHAAVKAIKAVDPQIEVMLNDDMWIVHYFFLDKGLPAAIDGLSIHPYSGGRPPEVVAVTANADWTKPYQVVDQDQSFTSAVKRLKAHWQLKMGNSPKMWITEWGWRVGELSPEGEVVDEARIANYLPRAFILAEHAGIKSTCWFSAQDIGDGPMGLKTNSGRYRPAFDAFVELSKRLGKSSLVCEVQAEQADSRKFLFRKENDWLTAAWKTDTKAIDQSVKYQKIINQKQPVKCLN